MKKLFFSTLCFVFFFCSCETSKSKEDYDYVRAKALYEKSENGELSQEENEEAADLLIAYYDLQASEAERIANEADSKTEARQMMREFEEKYGDYHMVLSPYDFFKVEKSTREQVNKAQEKNRERLKKAEEKLQKRLADN